MLKNVTISLSKYVASNVPVWAGPIEIDKSGSTLVLQYVYFELELENSDHGNS